MKFKVYFAGIMAIVMTIVIVLVSASFLDIKAASTETKEVEKMSSESKINSENITETSEESIEDANISDETETKDYSELQKSYNELVVKYNDIVSACKDTELASDDNIRTILNQAAEILTEMGSTDLDTASDEDIEDLTESLDLMNTLLDQIADGMNLSTVAEIPEEEIVAEYEKPDFSVTTTNDEEFTLYEQGGNVIVLNFFATWCAPCKDEMHYLQKLQNKYKDSNVKMISICCGADTSEAKKFMDNNGFTFSAAGDSNGTISESYNISSIPHTFVFSPTGKLVGDFEGLYEYSDYENAIEEALK